VFDAFAAISNPWVNAVCKINDRQEIDPSISFAMVQNTFFVHKDIYASMMESERELIDALEADNRKMELLACYFENILEMAVFEGGSMAGRDYAT
jgi:hypothetical protein